MLWKGPFKDLWLLLCHEWKESIRDVLVFLSDEFRLGWSFSSIGWIARVSRLSSVEKCTPKQYFEKMFVFYWNANQMVRFKNKSMQIFKQKINVSNLENCIIYIFAKVLFYVKLFHQYLWIDEILIFGLWIRNSKRSHEFSANFGTNFF